MFDLRLDSDDDPLLQRRLLLASMVSHVSDADVHETFLDTLETIFDFDIKAGVRPPESIKTAYCAVAVDSTVKYLSSRDLRLGPGKYFQAVERIWRLRIGKLETDTSDLISDDLLQCRDDIETAVWDNNVADKLLKRNARHAALKALATYLNEAQALLGPTLLDSAIRIRNERDQTGTRNRLVQQIADQLRGCHNSSLQDANDVDTCSLPGYAAKRIQESTKNNVIVLSDDDDDKSSGQETDLHDKSVQIPASNVTPKNSVPVWTKREIVLSRKRHGPLKISTDYENEEAADGDDYNNDGSPCKIAKLSSSEVSKVQRALKTSVMELNAVVQDPLPEALRIAQDVVCKMPQKYANIDTLALEKDQVEKDRYRSSNRSVNDEPVQEGDNLSPRLRKERIPLEEGGVNDQMTIRVSEETIPDPVQEGGSLATRSREETIPVVEDDNLAARSRKETILVLEGRSSDVNNHASEIPVQVGDKIDTRSREDSMPVQVDDHANKKAPQPSLMERNHTARTLEWEDVSSGEISDKAHFPIPKREAVSLPNNYNPENVGGRRMKRRWSPEEEETLKEAVNKFGKGNWTLIQNAYADTFKGRTSVDLKDKWRNMMRMGLHRV